MDTRPVLSARPLAAARTLLLAAAAGALGACSQVGGLTDETALSGASSTSQQTAQADPQSELQRATEHWGKEFAKNPRSKQAALNYTRNLKAMGQKQTALAVMQQASVYHGADREIASEFGRLALELDQVSLATTVLAVADDPTKPDWKVISARGAAHAKQGQYAEALPLFERANALSGGNPTVLNNLAMAYTATGQADKAETLLRQALESRGDDPKIRQNLAIVLGLQGRYDEAKQVGSVGGAAEATNNNVEAVRQIVRLEPRRSAAAVQSAVLQPPAMPAAQVAAPAAGVVEAKVDGRAAGMTDAQADALVQKALAASQATAQPAAKAAAVAGWSKQDKARGKAPPVDTTASVERPALR